MSTLEKIMNDLIALEITLSTKPQDIETALELIEDIKSMVADLS